MTEPDPQLEVGQRFRDRYRIVALIGAGGFGNAWQAHDEVESRDVVLKILHRRLVDLPGTRRRFAAEAEALARLDHPRIVKVFEAITEHDPPYIVMEHLRGRVLRQEQLKRAGAGGRFSFAEVLRIFDQICEALGAAHEAGIVHRDVKPANIMLLDGAGDLELKLLDFGLAKLLDADFFAATTLGRRLGSVLYWSPEQALGQEVGPLADQFAAATVLFELLTLRRAWARDPSGEPPSVLVERLLRDRNGPQLIYQRMIDAERPRVSPFRPRAGATIDAVLARAWSKEPEARFAGIRELQAAVHDALDARAAEPPGLEPSEAPVLAPIFRLPISEDEIALPTTTAQPTKTALTMTTPRPEDGEGADITALSEPEVPLTAPLVERPRSTRRNLKFFFAGMVLALAGFALVVAVLERT